MAFIVNTAQYLPANEIFNDDLTQFPPKYRQLIEEKAGIKTRRHVTDECTSDLGALAVKELLCKTGMNPGYSLPLLPGYRKCAGLKMPMHLILIQSAAEESTD